MRPHHTIALLLALALVVGAAAAGEETPPAFPHEFYGSVTIDGAPAPAGTVITGVIEDISCGSIQVIEAGRYGDPDRRKGNRLLVEGTSRQKGATISFLANGATAKETVSFTPGAVTCLNLSFEGVVTAPVAAFSANVTEGDAPLTVAFTDESTGAATWSWTFGDNTTSADQNPTHTYATAGTYTVTLTVTNTAGSDSATATITVSVPVGNIAVTSAPANAAIWLDGEKTGLTTNTTLTNISAGEHVITLKLAGYADASTPVTVEAGKTASVHLDLTTLTGSLAVTSVPAGAKVFIDGADTGKLTNTTIDGIGVGTHTVTLRKEGYVDAAAEIVIEEGKTATLHLDLEAVVTAPVAAFKAEPISGDAPLTVAFTDESTGAATWSWTFGDNTTSADQNPTHTYATAGTYTVTLTVTNTAGSDRATATITVTVAVGNIAVTSTPAGAAIWLDGEKTGLTTNTTLTNISAGEHVITLKLAGYADASTPVTVEAGKTASVHLDLTTLTGSLAVTSVPAGAKVFIDSADTGKLTNTTIGGIGVGTHTVTLKKDGYIDAAAEIVIEEGKTAPLHLDLEAVVTAPVAAFSANVTEGDAPLTVAFTDESTGAATWSWDFGDNTTSADQNPTHTYATAGTYTVTLTVTNTAGSDSATATITVSVPVGNIAVTSTPANAAIWLDGENTGLATNTTLTGIPAGEHVITLKLAGYADTSTPVTVEAGKTVAVHLDLTTLTGSLAVTSVPAGAKVFIDGADTGKLTNTTIGGIGVGTHTVTLRKDGYVDAAAKIVIEEGKTATLHLDLEEIIMTGSIEVTSVPAGAAIFLDGENTGKFTNAALTGIPAGEHNVTLKLAGYLDATKTVTVTAGVTTALHFDLVEVVTAPAAAFTANVTSGVAPLTVAFTDTSTGADSWSWAFGDGGTSSKQNPVHTYLTAETYTVTLTVTNAGGSSSTTAVIIVQEIPPQRPEAAENFTLESDAVSVSVGDDGTQQVTFNATAGTGKIGDDNRTIHFQVHDLNITIETGGLTNGTGNVTGVHLESAPVNATVGTGNVSVSFTAEMNNYNPALGITTSIYEQPSSEAKEAFILAAQEDEGSEITGIAYAVYFIKTNLTGNDKIQNATLRLTVSEDWVKAHGGIDKIRIFRRGDDGSRQVLPTTYEGMENGMMVFTAVSPEGFSAFALGAVAPSSPPAPAPSRSGGGGGGGSQASVGAAGNLKAGDRVVLSMDRTAISAVTFTAKNQIKDVMVTMAKGSLPRDARPPTGTVYQYVEATLYRAAAEDFSSVQFRFAVPTAWLTAQGCTKDEVRLFRLTDDGWREVPVEALGEENGNAIFTAGPEGFSLFAITVTGKAPGVEEPTLEPIETETTPPVDVATPVGTTPTTPQPTPLPVGIAVLALGVSLFLVRRRT